MADSVNTAFLTETFANPLAAGQGSSVPTVIGSPPTTQPQAKWFGGAVTNEDDGSHPEDGLALPWVIDPVLSWYDYRCVIDVRLDPGTVLHKPLPQTAQTPDSLASFDVTEYALASSSTAGINLKSNSTAVDVIQRMATSTYHFVLKGWGLRAGYQIPIPGLVQVGSLRFTPTWPQQAANDVCGNLLGGIPLWYATWELHYLVAAAPMIASPLAAANPAAHIRPDAALPQFVRGPRMPTDQNAVRGFGVQTTGRIGGFR